MTKQVVNIGTADNSGDGDPLRTAFGKINANFTEIYAKGPVGSQLLILGSAIAGTDANGEIVLQPTGTHHVTVNDNVLIISVKRTITSPAGSIGDVAGMIAWDANYIYVCTASYDANAPSASIWRRAAIGTW